MKLKLSILAGALALAVAGQANAAIVNGAGNGNDLVLSVWDQTNNTSYTADLGTTMTSMLTGVSFGGTAAAPAISGSSTTGSFSFNDATLTSFLSTANLANTTWSVTAVNMAVAGYGTSGAMFTSASPLSTFTAQTTANLLSMENANTAYLKTVNSSLTTAGTPNATTYSTTVSNGGMGYVGAAGNGMGVNLGGNLLASDAALVGTSQNFFFLTPTTNARGTYAGSTGFQFANATGASTFNLTSTGLTYAAASVAAVPEPSEWLLMMSGFGLIGFIANRRKAKSSVTFA